MNKDLQKEIQQVQKDCRNISKKPLKEVLKAYKISLDNVQNEISVIVDKYNVDGVINISSKQRYSELKSLEKKLTKEITNLGDLNIKKTTDLLSEIYSESYYRTAYVIDKGIDIAIDFSILRPEFIESAINTPIENITYSKRIWKNQKNLINRIYKDVQKALVNGKSPEKLARQIKKDFGVTAYQASRLINTEVARAMSMAQDEIYNNSDVVQKVMWDATLDSLTSAECAELDGEYFPKDNHPTPPKHPNCRCCIIPVVDGWKPTKKLDNTKGDKKIIDYQNYDSWYKSKAEQDVK